ncbi:C-24(28) sterol reductase, partial [Bonamia ostreae]
MMWWFTDIGIALKMLEERGTVTTEIVLICFFHLCFVNACFKGEQCVINSFDIIEEKFGWMLLMLDIVMVPFVFPLQTLYIYSAGIEGQSKLYLFVIFLLNILGYFIFDTANSQKDYFREGENPVKRGFPNLCWGKLDNPR